VPGSRRITFLTSVTLVSLTGLGALTVAACGGNGNGHASAAPTPPTSSSGPGGTVAAAHSSLGTILVDSRGRTLYLFKADSWTTSACFGACATAWPPLRANGQPTVASGANSSLAATTARSDGAPQVTYNNHPVYLFVGDKKPGDTNGQGVVAFGGGWFALSPTGDQISGSASSGPGGGTSSPGGGGGY
jgi:predicted lipoprotein with Yx(FWY)xxD motif